MIARRYKIGSGIGRSVSPLVSFDKALITAGVGNYNLVKLSSILPANCIESDEIDIEEGSLLPVAYSTISSDKVGDTIVSTIGVGIPKDKEKVGLIMEYSVANVPEEEALETLHKMIKEGLAFRGWELDEIKSTSACTKVQQEGVCCTTFCCIAEW